MPTIKIQPDTLNAENARFPQTPLRAPLFLNSVPKSGSHLLRNIIRMFVPVTQQYDAQFIQWANLDQHLGAFDPKANRLSWGHLLFSDASAIELAATRKILLVRDPHDWVLARARFFVSDEFDGNMNRIKQSGMTAEQLMNLMIFGIHGKVPSLNELYMHNAAAWMGTGSFLVRYEELKMHVTAPDTPGAVQYFGDLFAACGIDMPQADWLERVKIGSDRKQSGTARENLTGVSMEFPDVLPEIQKKLVEYAAPGLRSLLGYTGP